MITRLSNNSTIILICILLVLQRIKAHDTIATTLRISNSNSSSSYHRSRSSSRSLRDWLRNLSIIIPDETFRKGIFSISIHNVTCSQYQIRSIHSNYNNSSKDPQHDQDYHPNKEDDNDDHGFYPSMDMSIYGVSASCIGMYKSGITSGSIEIHLSTSKSDDDDDDDDDETIVLQMILPYTIMNISEKLIDEDPSEEDPRTNHSTSTTFKIPISINVTICQIQNLEVPTHQGIIFTGSISATFIELFSRKIAQWITSSITKELCPVLSMEIHTVLTQHVIQPMNDYLIPYIIENTTTGMIQNYKNENKKKKNQHPTTELWTATRNTAHTTNTSPTNIQDPSFYIQWDRDIPFLQMSLFKLNSLFKQFMNQGLLLSWLFNHFHPDSLQQYYCKTNCGYFFLGINGFIRYWSLDGNGTYIFPSSTDTQEEEEGGKGKDHDDNDDYNETQSLFHFSIPIQSYGLISISCISLQITNVADLNQLVLAYPLDIMESSSSSSTANISSSLDMQFNLSTSSSSSSLSSVSEDPSLLPQGWNILLDVNLRIDPQDTSMNADQILEESFQLHLQMSNISFSSILQLGIDKSTFEKIRISDIIHSFRDDFFTFKSNNAWILLLGLKQAFISHLDLYTVIDQVEMYPRNSSCLNNNTVENDLDSLINTVMTLILHEYDMYVTQAIHALISQPVRYLLNDKLEKYILNATIFHTTTTNNKPVSSFVTMDDIMLPVIVPRKEDIEYTSSFLPGIFTWNMSNTSIRQLNQYIECIVQVLIMTINETFLPKPIVNLWKDEFILNVNSVRVENMEYNTIHQIDVEGIPNYIVHSVMNALEYDVDGSRNFDNRHLLTSISMSLEIPSLWIYGEIDASLIMANMSTELYTRVQYNIEQFHSLLVHEVFKNSSRIFDPLQSFNMEDWVSYIDQAELVYNLNLFMGKVSSDTVFINGSQSLASALNSVTNTFFGVTTVFINAYVNDKILKKDSQSNVKQHGTWELSHRFTIVIVLFVLLAVTMNIVYLRSAQGKDGRKALEKKESSSAQINQVFRFSPQTRKQLSSSLMFHPSIDSPAQYLVPVTIIGSIFLFISSNLSIGASVDLIFHSLDGASTSFHNLFIFSFGKTIEEMFQARVYLLMALVLLFSGIFPYLKLILIFYTWVCPEVYLSRNRRQKILSFLDAYGKYSLVDSFVLVLMLVSFHFELNILGTWSTFVMPDYGFYSFMFATVLSLLLGHYLVYLHRASMLYATDSISISSHLSAKESVWNHSFKNKAQENFPKISPFPKIIWSALLGLSFMILIVGFDSPFIKFEFEGLVGSLLGPRKIVQHSMISLGKAISQSSIHPSIGIIMIQWTYFFYTMYMPLMTLAVVSAMCKIPMTIVQLRRTIILAEICNAWNALDVFLVSIIASILDLSTFANFMIGHNCDIINRILKDNFDTFFDGKNTCFGIHTSIGRWSVLLFAGTLLQGLLTSICLKVAHLVLRERMDEEIHARQRTPKDDDSFTYIVDILPGIFFLWK